MRDMKEIVCRSQHAKKGPKWYGPDMYMAVVDVPEGGESVGAHPLSEVNIRKFGWKVLYVGEFYSKSTGPKSAYTKLLRKIKEGAA